MSREPLLLPAFALSAGILLAQFTSLNRNQLHWLLFVAFALLVLSLLRQLGRAFRLGVVLSALLLGGLLTSFWHRQTSFPKLDVADGETAILSGCVSNPPVFAREREQFTLDLAPRASIRVSVDIKGGVVVPLNYGQRVEVTAKVRSPHNFGNPEGFDYTRYLAQQNIYWTGSVSDLASVRVLPGRCGSRAVGVLFAVRTWALERIRSLYPGDPHTAALLQATLLGETSGVERRWTSDFRVTGTYHALVISGQHVSVLAFTLLLLLKLLQIKRLPALGIAAAASWAYAFISGFSSPVVRAAGGFTLFLVASYFFRRSRILNVLAAVGLIYLAFAPDELFDPSFQLSFLSAAAIAVFAIPFMERWTEPLRNAVDKFDQEGYDPRVETRAAQWRVELRLVARTIEVCTGLSLRITRLIVARAVFLAAFVADAVIVSGCVQFGLALPMISYFHRLSLTGMSANIIVIPLLSAVVPLGFASIATGSRWLAAGTKYLLIAAELVAGWHVHFEPPWRLAALPLWVSLSFAASLIVLAYTIRRRRRWLLPSLTVSFGLFLVACWQPWRPILSPGLLEVDAIDVGQGDSLLVVLPNGETMLVDAGGFPGSERMAHKPQLDIGEDVVAPYLWSRRIRHLDYVVLTHGHSDHMGGMPAILDDFRPKELWIGAEPESAEWADVERHAREAHVRIRSLNRATAAQAIGGTEIRILSPSADYTPAEKAGNNDSLVLEIQYRKHSALLMGDAERVAEDDMEASGQLRPVTLLKVGHHGSRTSSSQAFLDQVTAQFAFISDGFKNQFHHPHQTVLEQLADHHASIFRTDQQGLLSFITDGDHASVHTFH